MNRITGTLSILGFIVFLTFSSAIHAAEPVRIPWNSFSQEFGASISSNGSLYFYSNRAGRGTDIYISRRVDGVFQPPEAIIAVNSAFDDQSPFVLPDESALIFSSNRDGSREFRAPNGIAISRDLYISRKIGPGWSEPERLPDSINTTMIEENPFIHENRLYFVRYPFGQPGLARIFVADAQNDNWGEARELFGFHAITPGVYQDRFYFARKRDANRYQIVWVPLAELESPDAENKIHPEEKLDTPADEASYTASPDGKLVVFCRRSQGGDYDLFELRNDPWDDQQTFSLTNILFRVNESAILPESYPVLDRLANFLKRRQTRILVTGHTDRTGNPATNLILSQERAASVKRALTDRGVNADRIDTDGRGAAEPVDQRETEEAYAKNRRTEFQILGE